ncbi:CMRF35-like molecule 6 [Dasypus novemcinctus]|uniref:CMRF35-like molecule 6 n=1 Tax=Dasypus novemcinctus TaxID=9361 RepID=UPI00265E9191|nr:CMRF35-like molecule 6 [Dasypus novemcinctus]
MQQDCGDRRVRQRDDGGQYWCGVETPWLSRFDPVVETVVTVSPASIAKSNPGSPSGTPNFPTSMPAPNGPRTTEEEPPATSPYPRSLLSSVHFLLLVFLEVPLLLGMLSAVLWVNRPQRGS